MFNNVTIIGGGNIGTLMAADIARAGGNVTIFTSRPAAWSDVIEVYDADDRKLFESKIAQITDNMQVAVTGADYIFVVEPAFRFEYLASQMLPYVTPSQKIGVIPGSGGAEFSFAPLIQRGCTLFGLQRVHSIARLREYGHSVYELGRKSELFAGSIPQSMGGEIALDIEKMFGVPVKCLPNYLAVTLTPSNPILHTSRLYAMFADYQMGKTYPKNILFYEEWTDHSSEMLFKCDAELQQLCDKIPMDLSDVVSLPIYYESASPQAMTAKIQSIKAFKGLTSPMKLAPDPILMESSEKAEGQPAGQMSRRYVPDFTSRYFTADFPYGLKIIKDIASLFEVPTPGIDEVWNWYMKTAYIQGSPVFELEKMNLEQDKIGLDLENKGLKQDKTGLDLESKGFSRSSFLQLYE